MDQFKPNKFGKFKKKDVINAGFKVIDYGVTASELERDFGIKLSQTQRLKYCMGFRCEQSWRGCVPVFDIQYIHELKQKGEI